MDISVAAIGLDQAPIVQRLFESYPEYFRRTEKSEVLPGFAIREMTDEVPTTRQAPGYKKVFCLISLDGVPLGVVDLHQNHPQQGKCYLGLLLISGELQQKGFGRLAYLSIEKFILDKLECSEVLLGVSEDNDVGGFWEKVGFKPNGRHYVWKGGDHDNNVFEMAKDIR